MSINLSCYPCAYPLAKAYCRQLVCPAPVHRPLTSCRLCRKFIEFNMHIAGEMYAFFFCFCHMPVALYWRARSYPFVIKCCATSNCFYCCCHFEPKMEISIWIFDSRIFKWKMLQWLRPFLCRFRDYSKTEKVNNGTWRCHVRIFRPKLSNIGHWIISILIFCVFQTHALIFLSFLSF